MRSSAARLALAAALVAVLWSGAVEAQSSGPIRLTPTRPVAPPPATEVKPAEDPKPVATEAAPSPGILTTTPSPPQPGIQVDTLQAVDADAIGTLSAEEGALPTTLWQGTPRPVADRLIGLLPALPEARVSRDLERRLLLSQALLPEGPAAEPKLLVARAEKLAALGEIAGIDRLLKSLPPRINDEALIRLKLDAAYLLFDTNGACAEVRRALGVSRSEAAQRGQAFCLAIAGDGGKAELSLRLLSEQGFKPDPVYDALMESLIHGTRARLPGVKSFVPSIWLFSGPPSSKRRRMRRRAGRPASGGRSRTRRRPSPACASRWPNGWRRWGSGRWSAGPR